MTFDAKTIDVSRAPYYALEIDMPRCAEVYGVSPCTANKTAGLECFNTLATCQDRANYDGADTTIIRLVSNHVVFGDDDGIPCIDSVSITPVSLELAGVAMRSTAVINCQTFPFADIVLDYHSATRAYDPRLTGDYFAKLKARWPAHQGYAARLIEKYHNDAGERTRTYLLESISGPDASGRTTIKLRDVLTQVDNEAVKVPPARTGVLSAAMTAVTTTLTVAAADAAQYTNATHLRVADEIMTLSTWAAGGSFTVVRGVAGTTGVAHNSGDAVAEVYHFDDNPIDVIRDTLKNEAGIPAALITDADWNDERDDYLSSHNVVGYVTKPTGIMKLIGDLCEQNALTLWHDELANKIKIMVMSQFRATDASYTDDKIIRDTWTQTEEPNKRLSRIITNFGPFDYSKYNDANNYGRTDVLAITTDFDDDKEKIINSDYIESAEIAQVQTTATRYLTQYGPIPDKITFNIDARHSDIRTGNLIELDTERIQGPDGLNEMRRYIVTDYRPMAAGHRYAVTGVRYSEEPDAAGGNYVTVSTANLDVFVFLGQPTAADDFTITIPAGVTVYSNMAGVPALDTGALPSGSTLTINLDGSIIGYGGAGGAGGLAFAEYEAPNWTLISGSGAVGVAGTDAVNMTVATTFAVSGTGNIWGGGGGGGGSDGLAIGTASDPGSGEAYGGGGGGGGASFATAGGGAGGTAEVSNKPTAPQVAGTAGQDGTSSAGLGGGTDAAHGASGGDGGAHGAAGAASSDANAGGAAGKAVDLNGNTATWSPTSLATLQAANQVKGAVS